MEQYQVLLTGLTPMLMHQDNIGFSEKVQAWRNDPANKQYVQAGDDRTPPWTWIGYVYHDTEYLGMPSDNLMTMLREGGTKVKTGNGPETYKKHSQAGIMIDDQQFDLYVSGERIPIEPINELIQEDSFKEHLRKAEELGFELLVKRAKVQSSKHVRVRPMFRRWELYGSLTVIDSHISGITQDILQTILDQAGALVGVGDWRPASPKSSGTFGKFRAEIERIG